jgi:hypothetical protein
MLENEITWTRFAPSGVRYGLLETRDSKGRVLSTTYWRVHRGLLPGERHKQVLDAEEPKQIDKDQYFTTEMK